MSSLVEHVQEKNKGNAIQSSSKKQHDVSSSKGGVSQKTGGRDGFLKGPGCLKIMPLLKDGNAVSLKTQLGTMCPALGPSCGADFGDWRFRDPSRSASQGQDADFARQRPWDEDRRPEIHMPPPKNLQGTSTPSCPDRFCHQDQGALKELGGS